MITGLIQWAQLCPIWGSYKQYCYTHLCTKLWTSVSSFLGESIGVDLLGCAVNSHATFRNCQSVYMILQPYQQ